MKADIHPEYTETLFKCACGHETTTRSTLKEVHTEICSACHPFYTGKQKLVDTAGRIEKFQRKYAKAKTKSKQAQETPAAPATPE